MTKEHLRYLYTLLSDEEEVSLGLDHRGFCLFCNCYDDLQSSNISDLLPIISIPMPVFAENLEDVVFYLQDGKEHLAVNYDIDTYIYVGIERIYQWISLNSNGQYEMEW